MRNLKNVTIEKFAQLSQREFMAVRSEMKERFERVDGEIDLLRRDMEAGFQSIGGVLKIVTEKLNIIEELAIENNGLLSRVKRLGKKASLA